MVSRHDATLNLSALLKHSVHEHEVEETGLLMPGPATLEADGLRLADPLRWRLQVQTTGGDAEFFLSGDVKGTAIQECRRCLEDVSSELQTHFMFTMVYRPSQAPLQLLEEDDENDTLVFGQPLVDFAPLLSQLFAMEQPLTVLCREDCKGLSPDGVNLNHNPEHSVPEDSKPEAERSSPFAVLKDLDV